MSGSFIPAAAAISTAWINRQKFQLPIMGAYKAMVESHFNVAFLFDETLTPERLAQCPVVFLPNVGALTAAGVPHVHRLCCARRRAYREQGYELVFRRGRSLAQLSVQPIVWG